MNAERTLQYRRNQALEDLLKDINAILSPAERELSRRAGSPQFPLILVIGSPRSGTTLTMQWLASLGHFAYPTNLMSRFYGAPAIGARIQLLLTDPNYQFGKEFADLTSSLPFSSNLGKTQGILSPNEFWYFWRRFIPNEEPRYLTEDEENSINWNEFVAELAAIEAVFGKPIATKGIILQYNLRALNTALAKVLFLFVRRHPLYNIQSLLESREKYSGSRNVWWSVKPKEYTELSKLDSFGQVAGQVYCTNKAIEEALSAIEPVRALSVEYEAFCGEPKKTYQALAGKLAAQGCEITAAYDGPPAFEDTNRLRLSAADAEAITSAYRDFSDETAKW